MVCWEANHYQGMSDRWDNVWGPLLKPIFFFQCWNIVNWTHRNKLQWNFYRIQTFLFKKMHLFVSFVKTAAILSRPQCVNFKMNNYIHIIKTSVSYPCHGLSLSMITHWGRDKMDAIFQTTISNGISWMKIYLFRLKFHWSLLLRVQITISQHWFR